MGTERGGTRIQNSGPRRGESDILSGRSKTSILKRGQRFSGSAVLRHRARSVAQMPRHARFETQHVLCVKRPCQYVACWLSVLAHALANVSRHTYAVSLRVELRIKTLASCASGQPSSVDKLYVRPNYENSCVTT
eukprot:4352219-Pyramimonas_sp.AAC.1